MRLAYDASKDPLIQNHEDKMLETYSKMINSYSSLFQQYDCFLEVGLFWNNFSKKKRSDHRLPFQNGYSCYIYCVVWKDGKEVHVKSMDGEADYYPLSVSWIVSSIDRRLFKTYVSLYSDTDDIENDMKEMLRLLSSVE